MDGTDIDDSLYSRQRYVLGDTAMQRMAKSKIFLSGLGGLGAEIAKNIILAGVKSVTLHDSRPALLSDLGCQFYLTPENVKNNTNRAKACSAKLAELNPYVHVDVQTDPLTATSDLSLLQEYQCVILTECSLEVQLAVDQFCRSMQPQIQFITADVYGVFCWSFVDFGDSFEVRDGNGEEPKEFFLSMISKGNPGIVTTLDNKMHGLENDDCVTFRELKGMTALNEQTCRVQVINPYQFSICDTSSASFNSYEHGGICRQIKQPSYVSFGTLEEQLVNPRLLYPDLFKLSSPINIHVAMISLHQFTKQHGRLPGVRSCRDADIVLSLANDVNSQLSEPASQLNESLIRCLSMTCQGRFSPLCAYLGGVVAQEALKAVTGKFTPLMQWLYLDSVEVIPSLDQSNETFMPSQDRYDCLRICVGQDLCKIMAELNLFMVGCGAIGCEMLKNFAMLGIASSDSARITITDNDLIEKSNLNRQFLFRPEHIRKPKSSTAAKSALEINPQLHIDPLHYKVCPQTETATFNDAFMRRQDIVVNALDNIEARRYVDSRCVTNQRPLLESGTMGTKGHVQVVLPHLTESYSSQRDPVDDDVPFCTLKSFPAVIEHCIQWARDKFESSFTQKPALFSKFWSANPSVTSVIQNLSEGSHMEGCIQVGKLCSSKPSTIESCIAIARLKFEKYFNHKAKHLLHAFPLDTKMPNGTLFWQSPKRPPVPLQFDADNELHMGFVTACARLYADINDIQYAPTDFSRSNMKVLLGRIQVPSFAPTSKVIETDESVKRAAAVAKEEEEVKGDELQQTVSHIQSAYTLQPDSFAGSMQSLSFEKDDDANGHIDFITACSNLRASMYGLEGADRLKSKRIAGHIVPAIATTTAAVAGLATVELVKILCKSPLECFKNAFMNLALPLFVLSEPGAVAKTSMSNGMTYSIWDTWNVHGNKDMTLQQFIQYVKNTYHVDVSMVVYGSKMVYVPIMPGHKKRLTHTMTKLLKGATERGYVDLVVSYCSQNDEDEMGPPLRYHFVSA